MKRFAEQFLLEWKNRKPLILRGARQTGKTYLIERFAQENFIILHASWKNWVSIFESVDFWRVLDVVPGNIGRKIKYNNVDRNTRSSVTKRSFHQLSLSNVIHLIHKLSINLKGMEFRWPRKNQYFLLRQYFSI